MFSPATPLEALNMCRTSHGCKSANVKTQLEESGITFLDTPPSSPTLLAEKPDKKALILAPKLPKEEEQALDQVVLASIIENILKVLTTSPAKDYITKNYHIDVVGYGVTGVIAQLLASILCRENKILKRCNLKPYKDHKVWITTFASHSAQDALKHYHDEKSRVERNATHFITKGLEHDGPKELGYRLDVDLGARHHKCDKALTGMDTIAKHFDDKGYPLKASCSLALHPSVPPHVRMHGDALVRDHKAFIMHYKSSIEVSEDRKRAFYEQFDLPGWFQYALQSCRYMEDGHIETSSESECLIYNLSRIVRVLEENEMDLSDLIVLFPPLPLQDKAPEEVIKKKVPEQEQRAPLKLLEADGKDAIAASVSMLPQEAMENEERDLLEMAIQTGRIGEAMRVGNGGKALRMSVPIMNSGVNEQHMAMMERAMGVGLDLAKKGARRSRDASKKYQMFSQNRPPSPQKIERPPALCGKQNQVGPGGKIFDVSNYISINDTGEKINPDNIGVPLLLEPTFIAGEYRTDFMEDIIACLPSAFTPWVYSALKGGKRTLAEAVGIQVMEKGLYEKCRPMDLSSGHFSTSFEQLAADVGFKGGKSDYPIFCCRLAQHVSKLEFPKTLFILASFSSTDNPETYASKKSEREVTPGEKWESLCAFVKAIKQGEKHAIIVTSPERVPHKTGMIFKPKKLEPFTDQEMTLYLKNLSQNCGVPPLSDADIERIKTALPFIAYPHAANVLAENLMGSKDDEEDELQKVDVEKLIEELPFGELGERELRRFFPVLDGKRRRLNDEEEIQLASLLLHPGSPISIDLLPGERKALEAALTKLTRHQFRLKKAMIPDPEAQKKRVLLERANIKSSEGEDEKIPAIYLPSMAQKLMLNALEKKAYFKDAVIHYLGVILKAAQGYGDKRFFYKQEPMPLHMRPHAKRILFHAERLGLDQPDNFEMRLINLGAQHEGNDSKNAGNRETLGYLRYLLLKLELAETILSEDKYQEAYYLFRDIYMVLREYDGIWKNITLDSPREVIDITFVYLRTLYDFGSISLLTDTDCRFICKLLVSGEAILREHLLKVFKDDREVLDKIDLYRARILNLINYLAVRSPKPDFGLADENLARLEELAPKLPYPKDTHFHGLYYAHYANRLHCAINQEMAPEELEQRYTEALEAYNRAIKKLGELREKSISFYGDISPWVLLRAAELCLDRATDLHTDEEKYKETIFAAIDYLGQSFTMCEQRPGFERYLGCAHAVRARICLLYSAEDAKKEIDLALELLSLYQNYNIYFEAYFLREEIEEALNPGYEIPPIDIGPSTFCFELGERSESPTGQDGLVFYRRSPIAPRRKQSTEEDAELS